MFEYKSRYDGILCYVIYFSNNFQDLHFNKLLTSKDQLCILKNLILVESVTRRIFEIYAKIFQNLNLNRAPVGISGT